MKLIPKIRVVISISGVFLFIFYSFVQVIYLTDGNHLVTGQLKKQ